MSNLNINTINRKRSGGTNHHDFSTATKGFITLHGRKVQVLPKKEGLLPLANNGIGCMKGLIDIKSGAFETSDFEDL